MNEKKIPDYDLNMLTMSSFLFKELTNNLSKKTKESIDLLLNKLSTEYKEDISYIKDPNTGRELFRSDCPRYSDGTYKPYEGSLDIYNRLSKEHKEEVNTIMDLRYNQREDLKYIRQRLYEISINVSKVTDVPMYQLYIFFKCLPEQLSKDDKLLESLDTSVLDLETAEQIVCTEGFVTKFIKEYKSDKLIELINKYYALDFLMDF